MKKTRGGEEQLSERIDFWRIRKDKKGKQKTPEIESCSGITSFSYGTGEPLVFNSSV